jgi:predicted dinucleotide-binding enzyme
VRSGPRGAAVGDSVSEQIADAAPEGTHVVKAFNSILQGVLAADKPVDVFLEFSRE